MSSNLNRRPIKPQGCLSARILGLLHLVSWHRFLCVFFLSNLILLASSSSQAAGIKKFVDGGRVNCWDKDHPFFLNLGESAEHRFSDTLNAFWVYKVIVDHTRGMPATSETAQARSLIDGGWNKDNCNPYAIDLGGDSAGIYQRSYSKGYIASLTKDKFKPRYCTGNPIDLETGEKVQYESNIIVAGNISFSFTYGGKAHNKWTNSFEQIVEPTLLFETERSFYKSINYPTVELACVNGWKEIKQKIKEPWVNEVVPVLKGKRCLLMNAQNKPVEFLTITATMPLDSSNANADAPIIKTGDGEAVSFSSVAPGNFVANNLVAGRSLKVNENDEWVVTHNNGLIEIFASGGVLKKRIQNAYIQEFYYDAPIERIKKIQDNQGHSLEYFYLGSNLQKVVTNDGRFVTMTYNGLGLLESVNQNGGKKIFHYEDVRFPDQLTGITDERGVRFATWKYDEKGRAISSEHAGGAEKTSLNFNPDGSTTVTNALGKKTTYSFTNILGVRRISKVAGEPTASCLAANQAYTYTDEGLLETKTDWNGNVTKYTYDNLGRELTRTQAYGTPDAKTVQTCWHASLNQPARIIEPTKITLFDYTASGQPKSQTVKPRPAGAVDCTTAL